MDQPPAPAPAVVPRLLRRLVDDAGPVRPGRVSLAEALATHHAHRAAWYSDLVGPLLIPASVAGEFAALPAVAGGDPGDGARLPIGLVADTGLSGLPPAVAATRDAAVLAQVEVAVAKRGEDPLPGLREFLALLGTLPASTGYAEIPLTWGLLGALDTLAEARAGGLAVAAKFRTGGLAAELFPTPVELAAVICACRDRRVPFKLVAGLHQAIRCTDPETGFIHHGFLNVLAGTLAAARGGEVTDVAELLAATDPVLLTTPVQRYRAAARPLWIGFGARQVTGPVHGLRRLGLLGGEPS